MNNNIVRFKIRKDDIMCKLLDELNGLTAEQLLKKYDIPDDPPIDIYGLLDRIGILTISFNFTEIEDIKKYKHGDILGAIFAKDDSLGIFYRESDTKNRIRFTLAHELAHCCLHADSLGKRHIELRSSLTANDSREREVNKFAGELLIPEKILRDIHSKYLVAPPLSNIAQIFQVSTNVMAARLDSLGLPYIVYKKVNDK